VCGLKFHPVVPFGIMKNCQVRRSVTARREVELPAVIVVVYNFQQLHTNCYPISLFQD
jgi:hypothetical protein